MIVMAMMLMLMLLPSAFSLFRWPKAGNAGVGEHGDDCDGDGDDIVTVGLVGSEEAEAHVGLGLLKLHLGTCVHLEVLNTTEFLVHFFICICASTVKDISSA